MNKIYINNLPKRIQNITAKGVDKNDDINLITGFDIEKEIAASINKLYSEIIASILIHDKLCIDSNNLIFFLKTFGIKDLILLLRSSILEIVDDDNTVITAQPISDEYFKLTHILLTNNEGLPNNIEFIEKKLSENFSFKQDEIDKLLLLIEDAIIKVSSDFIVDSNLKELNYDLNNQNVKKSFQITSSEVNEITKIDILKVLRIAHTNKGLIYANILKADNILTDGGSKLIIEKKLSPITNIDNSIKSVETFKKITTRKGLPDLGYCYQKNIISIDDILKIRNNFQGKLFREWFKNVEYNEKETMKVLLNQIKPNKYQLAEKYTRWLYPNLFGLIGPAQGFISSYADSFIVGSILKGWHPSIFLDEKLKLVIDEKINMHERIEKRREIIKKFPHVKRNDLCPCGKGIKFKRCHGRYL